MSDSNKPGTSTRLNPASPILDTEIQQLTAEEFQANLKEAEQLTSRLVQMRMPKTWAECVENLLSRIKATKRSLSSQSCIFHHICNTPLTRPFLFQQLSRKQVKPLMKMPSRFMSPLKRVLPPPPHGQASSPAKNELKLVTPPGQPTYSRQRMKNPPIPTKLPMLPLLNRTHKKPLALPPMITPAQAMRAAPTTTTATFQLPTPIQTLPKRQQHPPLGRILLQMIRRHLQTVTHPSPLQILTPIVNLLPQTRPPPTSTHHPMNPTPMINTSPPQTPQARIQPIKTIQLQPKPTSHPAGHNQLQPLQRREHQQLHLQQPPLTTSLSSSQPMSESK